MKRQKLVAAGILGLAIIAVVVWLFFGTNYIRQEVKQEVSQGAPVDVVLDFYEPWLAALLSTTTDPYQLGLAQTPILSKELRTRLASAKGHPETEPDPVLCQTTILDRISARPVYELEDSAQVLVMSTQRELTSQAIVTLLRYNDGWYINDILCTLGEFAPPQEFSFEKEGYMLKSVVAPLNPDYWHLIFEENNQKGHSAPLFFNAESMCKDLSGNTSVCNLDEFVEPFKVLLRGEMTEAGVEVKQLEMID